MVLPSGEYTVTTDPMDCRFGNVKGPVESHETDVAFEFVTDFSELTTMLFKMIVPISSLPPIEEQKLDF